MTNPYDPDPTTSQPVPPGAGASADPFSPSGEPTSGTYATETYPSSGYVGTSDSTTDVAKDEAANVKGTAVDAGKDVAETAKAEASNVASEAKTQAKGLVSTVLGQAQGQASTQQQRLAGSVKSLASELGSMASKSEQSGPATDLAHQASQKVGEVGQWLENRDPADLLEELRSFARRRPAVFLGGAALAGVVAGRLTRSAVGANTQLDSPEPRRSRSGSDYSSATYDTGYASEANYATEPAYTSGAGYDTGYADTAQRPASMVEELPASPENSAAADYNTGFEGRGDVIR